MREKPISYEAGGLNMLGVYYVDDTKPGKRPAVLVFPEAFGIGPHAKSRAKRLAEEFGYAALACDLHGDAKLVQEMAELGPLLGPLRENPLLTRERTNGALKALIAQPEVDASKVGAIGFCFGGTMCLELMRGGADVKGIVGFHSGLYTKRPDDAKNIKGKVLVCIGTDDPGITPQERANFEN
jgi:dienelactone hydrolase